MTSRNKQRKCLLIAAAVLATCGTAWCVDYLTEGVDNSRTGWLQNDKSFSLSHCGKHEAPLEDPPRQQASRDAQPVSSVDCRQRRYAFGQEGSRRHRRSSSDDMYGLDAKDGHTLWHINFDSRKPDRRPCCRYPLPGRPDCRPCNAQEQPRPLQGICHLLGWPSAHDQSSRRARMRRRWRNSCRRTANLTRSISSRT